MRVLLAAVFALATAQLHAAGWPDKSIRVVVPFAAGSATDSLGRVLAQELSSRLKQSVLVENRPGAFGQIAAQYVARSAPDGYTLFLSTNTPHAANPHLYRTLPYDPIKDFAPVARVGTIPFMLVVSPTLPANSTAQLVAYARSHPTALSYATPNSTSLVVMETIKRLAKVSIVGVQYKASPEAILDLAAGRLQVTVADFTVAMPQAKAGKLRVLGVTTARRSALLPDVPAIAEAIPGVDVAAWFGLFAPAGTPREIVARLARDTLDILAQPEVEARLAAIGFELDPLGPDAFGRYVREQIAHWGQLIRAAGIEPQ